MTARPINYLLRRAAAPLVDEANRSLIRHGDDCLLVSRSPDPRLIRERNERKDWFSFSFFLSK